MNFWGAIILAIYIYTRFASEIEQHLCNLTKICLDFDCLLNFKKKQPRQIIRIVSLTSS